MVTHSLAFLPIDCLQHHAHAVIDDALREAQRTEQLLSAYQAAAHMLRYVLEPAGAGADNEGVARGREELAAARVQLTNRRRRARPVDRG